MVTQRPPRGQTSVAHRYHGQIAAVDGLGEMSWIDGRLLERRRSCAPAGRRTGRRTMKTMVAT